MKAAILFLLLLTLPAYSQFGNASRLRSREISVCAPTDQQVYAWDVATNQWKCATASSLGGNPNAHVTFSNAASAAMTLTGVADHAVVDCYDSTASPPRLLIPDHVDIADANTVTAYFVPNATGYCNGSTGVGATGATGPAGPSGGLADPGSNGIMKRTALDVTAAAAAADVVGLFSTCSGTQYLGADGNCHTTVTPAGSQGDVQVNGGMGGFDANSGFNYNTSTRTVTIGTSVSVDGTTGIATSSKIGNAAISLLTGAGKWSSGVPVGQAACADLSNASAACSSLTNLTLVTPVIGAATGTSLVTSSLVGNNKSGGTLLTLPTNTGLYDFGANARSTAGSIANPAFFTSARWDGTVGSPTAVQSGEQIGGYNSYAYDGSTLIGPLGSFRCFANQNQSVGAGGTYCEVATTANGSTTLTSRVRWEADGGVTLPSTVTGGDKGAGTFNATGLYQANVQVATLSGTEALTNKTYNGNTFTAGTGVLTIAASKTATFSNTLTFSGTDSTSYNMTNQRIRGPSGTFAGALAAGQTVYTTVPYGCSSPTAWDIVAVDASKAAPGTVTVTIWKVASGTAVPTVSNIVSTGLTLSTGTALHSTDLSSFTGASFTANDIVGWNLTAAGTAVFVNVVLQCDAS